MQAVQLLQMPARRGDEQRSQLLAPAPASAGSRSQWRATSSRVCLMFRALEAPNTIASTFGCAQTHSIASSGGIAPEANTDIAIARNRRSRSACS